MAGSTISITVNVGNMPKLETLAAQLKPRTIAAMQASFREALPTVIGRERVRTGTMRNSTTYSGTGTGAIIRAAAPYSGFQDLGTRYMSGTHFMQAGLDHITQSLPTALQKIFAI